MHFLQCTTSVLLTIGRAASTKQADEQASNESKFRTTAALTVMTPVTDHSEQLWYYPYFMLLSITANYV